jgi:hypothetical protein
MVYSFFSMLLYSLLIIIIITNIFPMIVPKNRIKLFAYIKNNRWFNSNYCVMPHGFPTKALQSDTGILEIVSQINTLMPQLADFINQFTTTVNESNISVVTDTVGNMSISVPASMPEDVANTVSKKIGVIDRLINTRGQEISDLLQKGTSLENKIKMQNPNYVSQLTAKIEEFRLLNASYKH